LVDRFFEARKMMAQMSGRMMGPGRKTNRKKGKGKKGKSKGRGPTPPKVRGGFPGMPGGFPDLSNMPAGLDQLPPGLEGIDISQFQQPKKK
ncbi:MAG TPA: signal recognition particle protein, partial [Gordonia polyisoprenivorans]|nr:signal recognition particle protein [Gordonia polyisoprenivorans]